MEPLDPGGPQCPGRNFSCSRDYVSFDIGRTPTYFSIVSCSLSVLGSGLIVLAYLCLREIRKGAQKVITLLAIADFFTAFGYLIGAGNFLTHYRETEHDACEVFEVICEIQSFITTWSSLCSFAWTSFLALYFYLLVVRNKHALAIKLLPWQNIVAWGIPLVIVLPILVVGRLGYAPYAASNWCYIKDSNYKRDLKSSITTISLIFVAGKFWEILSYFVVLVLYGVTRLKLGRLKV